MGSKPRDMSVAGGLDLSSFDAAASNCAGELVAELLRSTDTVMQPQCHRWRKTEGLPLGGGGSSS